ncbi:peptidoglycan DD-metalloendopeptidase family protein [Cytophagales bacterium LB-30]|uniref:Peptidoglycan DD-metalloendopeptidase family protein n=1 Tax=Shiella aurantiaca TaxID=3058365 RepID=A0ABT8F594_9BACT|nr:peptidoglycan DD-metalloendopeptidase family protein [Shiella aurantiaca]MDN4165625.1 peptidoglycan DD-metalloendopeptidase family protein [Shiella aurantiaca]
MKRSLISLFSLIAISALVFAGLSYYQPLLTETELSVAEDSLQVETVAYEPTLLYGLVVDNLQIFEQTVKPNQNLSEILSAYNVPTQMVYQIAKASKEVFDVRRILAHKKVTVLCANDSAQSVKAFVYEPSPLEYVVFDLSDSIKVYKQERPIEVKEKTIVGSIESSLWESMMDAGASPELFSVLHDVYAWQIDFFRIQKGDAFKVIYEDKIVEGQSVGVGRILAAEFSHMGNPYYAFYYNQGSGEDYFDEEGNSLRKAFLKAPLNYSRISSRFSYKRFHPVQKRYKAHLGTDYAAPVGTPIMSVGDGVIVEATFGKYNGNYVKVRHNSTYTTQYLHMSKIASGIKPGTKVRQGQVIGYVGKTGLASGPHLCFRFWKGGQQVDAMRVQIPPSEPIKEDHRTAYMGVMKVWMHRLQEVKNTGELPKNTVENPIVLIEKEESASPINRLMIP